MKVGLIGNGGREHAIARGLCANPETRLFVAAQGKNSGIMNLASAYQETGFSHPHAIIDFFTNHQVDFVVVGPEATLMLGIVDELRSKGIPTVGPTQAQARLEGDKSFMRHLLRNEIGWGSPAWLSTSSVDEAKAFMDEVGQIVVKPLGLTGGKGVRVMGIQLQDDQDTLNYISHLIESDGEVLLEECVIGEEFSRMAFVSDEVLVPVPLMQDFKYAYDGDQGLMTGGMGAYSMADGRLPFVEIGELKQADVFLQEVVVALEKTTGASYRGFLYGQFMVTESGIKLIEFNVRLGDPEALNLMAVLDCDPVKIFYQVATGQLNPDDVAFVSQASVSKYLVPNAYPDPIGQPVPFLLDSEVVEQAGLILIHGSVEKTGPSEWLALGSRTLGMVGLGVDPGEVSTHIDEFLTRNPIPELRYRKDVGNADVIAQKSKRMDEIRSDR
ncbi:MAG: phosphoribosylamine--glycine ligase [Brevefilum sp.]|nr:phosphoribosylamine--glycine ligase [Brevefilum sp.]